MNRLLIRGNALHIPLADRSVHCCVTSPPYWGLRDYGVAGQLGLEASPDAYVAGMVAVFREVWRILRDDGCLWLNIGDSYASGEVGRHDALQSIGDCVGATGIQLPGLANSQGRRKQARMSTGLRPKSLIGIPWRLAFALQADGWILRSEIIWAKPNPIPESVRDRPTKAHEQVFLLTKRERYFYDADAVREKTVSLDPTHSSFRPNSVAIAENGRKTFSNKHAESMRSYSEAGRNKRSVWSIPSHPFSGAHFATMPVKLAATCIKASTSKHGVCSKCGAPWVRVTERSVINEREERRGNARGANLLPGRTTESGLQSVHNKSGQTYHVSSKTLGWRPTCSCNAPIVPARVFDPFGGAMTTIVAAEALGRIGIATELSAKYIAIGKRRLERPHVRTRAIAKEETMPLFDRVNGHAD